MTIINVTVQLEVEECCNCGVAFGMTSDMTKRRRDDKKAFYCPSGHSQSYVGTTLEKKLQEANSAKSRAQAALRVAQVERDAAERSRARTKVRLRNAKKRAAAGVCGFCQRQFKQVKDHVERMHPAEAQDNGIRVKRP